MATDNTKEKLALIEWIIKQDKSVSLKSLTDIVSRFERDKEDHNSVVGYRSRGVRVTRKQLVISLQEMLDQLDQTELISLDKLEQESDRW